MSDLIIRPLEQDDKAAWRALWTAYLTFYESSVAEEVYDIFFDRLLGNDTQDYNCLLAVHQDQPIGLTHFLYHRHGWSIENVCYLHANSVFSIIEVDSDYRSELLALCLIFGFHKMIESQITEATSTTFSFYLVLP